MSRFAERSDAVELIDNPGIPFSDWQVCLRELDIVNTYLGGHAISIEGIKKLAGNANSDTVSIMEIGCGGGDNLKAIYKWNKQSRTFRSISFIGVDINEACTQFAAMNCRALDVKFITSDYKLVSFAQEKPDIIFNSLFCHHFTNQRLLELLQWMNSNSKLGFFVNDLHRHPVAYYSIKALTKIFSRSYLVKNDGPISVSRGFTRSEWQRLLKEAGIKSYSIHWRWAFRYLIVVRNDRPKNI